MIQYRNTNAESMTCFFSLRLDLGSNPGHVTSLHLYRQSVWPRSTHKTLQTSAGRHLAPLPLTNSPLISPHISDPSKTVIASSENTRVL
jgi:hypothetical protein